MPHSIALSPERDIVVLAVRDAITAAAAMEYNREAHLFGLHCGVSRYLVDLRGCSNVDSVSNNLHFALSDMAVAGLDKNARVALLATPGDHSHDYVEAALRCAGLDVVLFNDRSLAEKHLRAGMSLPGTLEKS